MKRQVKVRKISPRDTIELKRIIFEKFDGHIVKRTELAVDAKIERVRNFLMKQGGRYRYQESYNFIVFGKHLEAHLAEYETGTTTIYISNQ